MSLVSQRDRRKDLRRGYSGIAQVRCRRCHRVVGECYGNYGQLCAAWPPSARPEPGGARAARWTCRCGGDYPVTGRKLAAAFAAAVASGGGGDIWVPDLGRY
jgi:hypothetical protein